MKPTPDMSIALKEDLERVLEKLDRLESLIKKQNESFEHTYYPTNPFPHDVHSTVCSKCGLKFEGVTSYYCPDSSCPMFFKVTC